MGYSPLQELRSRSKVLSACFIRCIYVYQWRWETPPVSLTIQSIISSNIFIFVHTRTKNKISTHFLRSLPELLQCWYKEAHGNVVATNVHEFSYLFAVVNALWCLRTIFPIKIESKNINMPYSGWSCHCMVQVFIPLPNTNSFLYIPSTIWRLVCLNLLSTL